MIVLGLDSATDACSAAVWIDGRIAARRFVSMARGHAEALMPMVVAVIDEASVDFAALDLVAATVGPGSFTGLRVGLAAARGIGLALGRPVVGITTLEALAATVAADPRPVLVALDDKRGGFYAQAFAAGGDALGSPVAVDGAGLVDLVPVGPFTVIGDGADAASRALAARGRVAAMTDATARPDAAVVAGLAARRHAAGTSWPASPLYVHAPAVTPPAARIALSTDARRLADLHRRCTGDAWDEAAIAGLLDDGSGFALLAGMGDAACGYLFGRVVAGEAEILGLGVVDESRRRGLGRDLIQLALAETKARGAKRVFLEVAADNAAAQALYAGAGFGAVGRRHGYYKTKAGPIDAVVLARAV